MNVPKIFEEEGRSARAMLSRLARASLRTEGWHWLPSMRMYCLLEVRRRKEEEGGGEGEEEEIRGGVGKLKNGRWHRLHPISGPACLR
jgi:hypothetical protein